MAQLPPGVEREDLTVAARRVLLDALEALDGHRDAVVLVGAQAVYQHTQDAQLGVAAYTADADIGLDPSRIGPDPLIDEVMRAASFSRDRPGKQDNPGLWFKRQIVSGKDVHIEVDLLVPKEMSDGGRRSVRLPPHDGKAMLRVTGLSVAMVDHQPRNISSLEPEVDGRFATLEVAGVPALLIAKAHKLGERLDGPVDRLVDKDASDIVGLMIASDAYDVAETFEVLLTSPIVGDTVQAGLSHLLTLFATPTSPGVKMAISALSSVKDPDEIRALTPAYVSLLPKP